MHLRLQFGDERFALGAQFSHVHIASPALAVVAAAAIPAGEAVAALLAGAALRDTCG